MGPNFGLLTRGRCGQLVVGECSQALQCPERMDAGLRRERFSQRLDQRGHCRLPHPMDQLMYRLSPHAQIRIPQRRQQCLDGCFRQIDHGSHVVAGVGHAPDAASFPVALGMRERNFVVADDPVVKVGNVERTIRANFEVDRPKPRVVTDDEVGLFDRLVACAMLLQPVVIDPARHRVPDEHRPKVFGRKVGRFVEGQAADPG